MTNIKAWHYDTLEAEGYVWNQAHGLRDWNWLVLNENKDHGFLNTDKVVPNVGYWFKKTTRHNSQDAQLQAMCSVIENRTPDYEGSLETIPENKAAATVATQPSNACTCDNLVIMNLGCQSMRGLPCPDQRWIA